MKDIKEYKTHTQQGILLNANEMSDNLSSSILKEIQEKIVNLDFNRYPDNDCIRLREDYSALLNVRIENVLAGNGSDQILGLLIGYFLKKGKTLLTLDPDFSMYDYYCGTYDANLLKYPTRDDGSFDVENFVRYAIDNKVDMILFSNPNNPTGFLLTNEEIKVLLKQLNTIPVVIDEAYAEFAKESATELIDQFDNLYITRTLSKAYALAGARVGFLVSNEKNIKQIHKANVPYVLNCVSQMIAMITLKHVEEFRNRIESIKKKRDEIDLQIDSVSMNEDGSLTVSLGYNNPCKEKIDIGQNNLKVTQGSAIILKNEKIETLDPGRHSNILTAVINEKTNLCWDINDKSIQVDGSKILKSIQGMENRA